MAGQGGEAGAKAFPLVFGLNARRHPWFPFEWEEEREEGTGGQERQI